jgi:hypothetical protein
MSWLTVFAIWLAATAAAAVFFGWPFIRYVWKRRRLGL